HWRFRSELERCSPGGNAVTDGDFERSDRIPDGWQVRQGAPDDLETEASITKITPHDGRQCLKLQVRPKTAPPSGQLPEAIEPAYLGVSTLSVSFAAGTLVRVSGWVKIDQPIVASADGALLYDSAGGEPLGVRLTGAKVGWKPITLYRRVPTGGQIPLTAAITGIGTVYFDDLKIEPLMPR